MKYYFSPLQDKMEETRPRKILDPGHKFAHPYREQNCIFTLTIKKKKCPEAEHR